MQIPIEQLLNLPDIQVLNVEITEREIKCDIESTRGYSICHRCGQKATKFFEHGESLTLRHLPICEKDVYLYLRTKRYRCLDCDGRPTTTERCEWYDTDAKRTKAFAEFLLRALVNSTISDVSIKYRVPYNRVRAVLGRYVRGEVDWDQFEHQRQIGLDEISMLKGHGDFVTIVSARDDQGKSVVLAVIEDRKKETVVAFLKSIPESLRDTVEEVSEGLIAQKARPEVRETLNSPRFRDQAPREVYATLLDEGRYFCSWRSMYRILEQNQEVRERRDQLRHPNYAKPELVATASTAHARSGDNSAGRASPSPAVASND